MEFIHLKLVRWQQPCTKVEYEWHLRAQQKILHLPVRVTDTPCSQQNCAFLIGASLSEPHTRELQPCQLSLCCSDSQDITPNLKFSQFFFKISLQLNQTRNLQFEASNVYFNPVYYFIFTSKERSTSQQRLYSSIDKIAHCALACCKFVLFMPIMAISFSCMYRKAKPLQMFSYFFMQFRHLKISS